MKLTKSRLNQVIKEELVKALKEGFFGDLQGEKRLGDAQAMSSDMRRGSMEPEPYSGGQMDDDTRYDGMVANIEAWTDEVLSSGETDLFEELHDFLEELLDKNEDPYRK